MSADNGIYILKTSDEQYRITHAQAIENIFSNHPHQFNLAEIIRYFGDCKFTTSKETALFIANKMNDSSYTEYGVKLFELNMKWGTVYKYGIQQIEEYLDSGKDFLSHTYSAALSRAKSRNASNFKK